jgi:CheY-like chemotaxis protein
MNDVLVVEDEPEVRALVGALLDVEGIPYRTAAHGGEALARVREARPAVVLLDIHMPQVSGPDFCERLHTEGSRDDITIVVMTAAAQAAEYERQCAADATLPKPFDIDQLLAVVTRFLHQDR